MNFPTTEPSMLDSLEQILAESGDPLPLPQVVFRIGQLTANPKATAVDLERLIGIDPALAARVLALANSNYYSLAGQISSLHEAVVFLGIKTLRDMAAAITGFNQFLGRGDAPALARRSLWRHSVDTAQCARIVIGALPAAARETVGVDQAYTAGLLHDIGKLALDHCRHGLFVSLMQMARVQNVRYHVIEAEVMPIGHAQIGASQAQGWNLPPTLCESIAYHHTPRAATLSPKLTAAVALANEIAHFLEDTPSGDAPVTLEDLLASCRESMLPLRIRPEALEGIVLTCRSEMEQGLSALAF